MGNTLVKNHRQLHLEDFSNTSSNIFGKKLGLGAMLFGCSHRRLSRPFSHDNVGYRTCIYCGARTKFDTETRETYGGFYYPAIGG
jgi:hypothetical protein